MSDSILTELKDGVLTVTLNRPDKANAFNTEMVKAAQKTFKEAARDAQVRVVLLTGSGRFFSAGQDLTEIDVAGSGSIRQHLLETYNRLVLGMRRMEKPIIGAINGAAVGAGLGVALACDLRIAAEDARFIVGFLGIGLAPDSAVSLMLPHLIGLARASEATFFNQPIDAQTALAWGLVNRLAPGDWLADESAAWAAQLAEGPVNTMGLAKRIFNKVVLPNLEAALDYEAHIQEIAQANPEHREGVTAFLQKRDADYVKAVE